MTIRSDPRVKEKSANKARSLLAAEAVEIHMDRESDIIKAIELGLADVDAGRTVSHEDAMAFLRQSIDAVAESFA